MFTGREWIAPVFAVILIAALAAALITAAVLFKIRNKAMKAQ